MIVRAWLDPPYPLPPPRRRSLARGAAASPGCSSSAASSPFAMLVAGTIALVVFLRSSTGQKVASAVGKGMKMTLAAQSAPGAREIAKVGCSPGMVMDAEETLGSRARSSPTPETRSRSWRSAPWSSAPSISFATRRPRCDADQGRVPRRGAGARGAVPGQGAEGRGRRRRAACVSMVPRGTCCGGSTRARPQRAAVQAAMVSGPRRAPVCPPTP